MNNEQRMNTYKHAEATAQDYELSGSTYWDVKDHIPADRLEDLDCSVDMDVRPSSIIVLGWLTPEIIKRCLDSINRLQRVDVKIYFAEQRSRNSDKIKELILSTKNVKGYIQMKENWAAASWKIIMEHFLPQIDDEFVTITDGDYVWDFYAIDRQYKMFQAHEDIGIISQKRSLLGMSGHWKNLVMNGMEMATRPDGRNAEAAYGELGATRIAMNGINLTTARKTDWEDFIDIINTKRIQFGTHRIGEPWIPEYRSPLFWDIDLYSFFENVFQKASFVIEENASYHITDEYENDLKSEYSKEKKEFGYYGHWRDYQADPEFYHNKFYDNGELKYNIII